MSDKKFSLVVAVLVMIIVAATYITVNIPPPQDKQIAEIKAQNVAMQAQINILHDQIKLLTHPAVMQQRALDWVLDKGEFERGDK